MTGKIEINKEKPWLTLVEVGTDEGKQALVAAGERSRYMSVDWHNNHIPQTLPQRDGNDWRKHTKHRFKQQEQAVGEKCDE